MTAVPGIELFLSSEKAVEGAAKFRAAVESAAQAVERIGAVVDKLDGALAKLGTTSKDATDPMAKLAKGAAAADAGLKQGATGAAEFSKQMAAARVAAVNAASAQSVLANSGRSTASALKLLGSTDTARQFDFLAQALGNAGGALRGFSSIAGATPLGAVATLATGAVLAFASLSEGVERTSDRFKKLADASREAEQFGRTLDDLRLAFRTGDRDAGASFISKLREELVALNDLSTTGQREVPAERVLAAIEQRAPETVGALRRVMAEMKALGEEGRDVPMALSKQFGELATVISNRFGVDVQIVGDKLTDLSDRAVGSTRSAVKGFTTDLPLAIRAVGIAFDIASGKADATQETIAKASAALRELQRGNFGGGGDTSKAAAVEVARTDALQEFLRGKLQEIELLGKEEEAQKRLQTLQEAGNALLKSRRPILEEELALVFGIAAVRSKFAAEEAEKKRAESVGEIIAKLERENALLEQQGAARQALQRQQEVEAALAKIKNGANGEERKLLDELIARNRELLTIEEQRNAVDRAPKLDRTREYLRTIEQEAELLRLSGEERERYRIQLEVENEVREQGLKLTKEEIAALVQKKQGLRELSESQAQASQLGREVGNALGNALEGFILDGKKARDVLRDLANDLARIAFRRTVTNNLENLFSSAIGAIGGAVGGVPAGGPVGVPRLTGGLIPAMVGAVIDQPTILQRGGQAFGVAEGGKTTPEAIFRLARDERGNLGISAVGGGGDTINMSFPGVRSAADAKAMRATIGQQVRALRKADRGGRRGRRPAGE